MGGFRRRMRRQARDAAKQLMRQGVPAREIGRVVEDARVGRVLLRVVEEMEKRLDGGEGKVTVREGLAAIKEIRQMKAAQQKALEQSAQAEEEAALEEEVAMAELSTEEWARKAAAEIMPSFMKAAGAASQPVPAGSNAGAAKG